MEDSLCIMFAHTRTHVKNPQMSEIGVTLDQIIHFHVNVYKLALTQGSFYNEFLERIAKKKVAINSKVMMKSTYGMSYYSSITSGRDLE